MAKLIFYVKEIEKSENINLTILCLDIPSGVQEKYSLPPEGKKSITSVELFNRQLNSLIYLFSECSGDWNCGECCQCLNWCWDCSFCFPFHQEEKKEKIKTKRESSNSNAT
jgi:hypothetical protein